MCETYARVGASPGRGSYDLATEAEMVVEKTRQKVARFFGAPDPERVIFAANATDALNLAIQGMLAPGDHVVTTRLEHNSVLRPLHHLAQHGGITYDLVPFDGAGFVDPDDIERAINPRTRLVIVNHASNVLGTVQDLTEIGSRCVNHNVPLLVDAAQSAGVIPIDMQAMAISALAYTGHKSLLGPTGTGGLLLNSDIEIRSIRFGGTGVDSKSLSHTQRFPQGGVRFSLGPFNTDKDIQHAIEAMNRIAKLILK